MSHHPLQKQKPVVSEMKRERDVFLLYSAAFRDIPHLEGLTAANHVARPSPDSTLTALCQLTAIRLGAHRAMISLIDDQRQHILAEATCDLPLRPERPGDAKSTLWLGNVSIPRTWGVCEQVLDTEPDESVVIINDVTQNDRTAHRIIVRDFPEMHFYAGAPLLSPSGATVGTVCIFDSKPRDGLSETNLNLLEDFAATIVDYLHTYTLKEKYRRGERFTRGLVSFSEGASSLVPFKDEDSLGTSESLELSSDMSTTEPDNTTDPEAFAGTEATSDPPPTDHAKDQSHSPQHRAVSIRSRTTRAKSARHRSIRTLQESILPSNSRSMFSRAANVIRSASNLDGVLILDASVAANGRRRPSPGPDSGTEPQSESYHSRSSSSDEGSTNIDGMRSGLSSSSSKMCQILGVATRDGSSEYGSLLEPDLARLLHEYSHGKVFTFTAGGLSMSSTEETVPSSGSAGSLDETTLPSPKRKNISNRALRSSNAVQAMFPGARSVAFVPFWDYERSRWFAGCLCWSDSPYRLLSASVDLAYFKVFSHSIMRELSRLDAVALNQSKTTFVASISHELRSPLHGILGTLEFIKDTALDSFQVSMLNSLNACGQTLLDTINHVMDHAKISETKRNVSSRRLKNENTVRLSSKPLKSRRNNDGAFDLGIATEEVVEAVFSGASYTPITTALMDAPDISSGEASSPSMKRKNCFIVLDLAFEQDWIYCFPVGSWRRIVMNIFGNAIKYTASGFIHVGLRANDPKNTDAASTVTLTITDSGCGMSPAFLANRAFQPFSQENPHAVGTGLGLSIVRQIIETNGGKIEISSDSSGTKLIVKLALIRPGARTEVCSAPRAQFLSFLPRLEGRRICILHRRVAPPSENPDITTLDEGVVRFTNALVTTLEKHLKMNVVQTAKWEGHDADIVILPELSFDYLQAIRRKRARNSRAPVTVFVAMDALEASALRSDARVNNRQSVVEIMTQPCGPYKLAYILIRCLDRFALPEENLQRPHSATVSPQPLPWRPKPLPQTTTPLALLHTAEPLTPELTAAVPSATSSTPGTPPTTATTATDPSVTSQEGEVSGASHILITDDNAINRRLLAAFLKRQKLLYQEASDGLEALNAYREGATRFYVILMDMSMPVMDGMTSTRAIRAYEHSRNIPRCCIIALTGLASASAKLEAWSSGIDHFMTKPINFKALRDVLKQEEERRKEHQQNREGGEVRDEEAFGVDVTEDVNHNSKEEVVA